MATSDVHPDLDRVTPLHLWFLRVGIPERTGHRLIKNGKGPALTELNRTPEGRERARSYRVARSAPLHLLTNDPETISGPFCLHLEGGELVAGGAVLAT
jgi:hypothetical protein